MENEYQSKFYLAEKKKSVSEFQSNYLLKNLQNKLNIISENFPNPQEPDKMAEYIDLIRNELEKEYEARKVLMTYCDDVPTFKHKDFESLTLDQLDETLLKYTDEYIKALSDAYTDIYRDAFRESNNIKEQYNIEDLQEMKRRHHNTSLEKFVTNKDEFDRIIEYKGKLIQKSNPIYLDPTSKFVKAHFYAPRKMVFGTFFPTIWVNVAVIWAMTIILYILLYYRALKKLLDFFENLPRRKKVSA